MTKDTVVEEAVKELIEQIPKMIDFDKASGSRYVDPEKAKDIFSAALERACEAGERSKVTGDTSDGYHTFNELYEFRKVYNTGRSLGRLILLKKPTKYGKRK